MLILALAGGVVWVARQADTNAATGTVDANWVATNQESLRRVLNLIPEVKITFQEKKPTATANHVLVVLDLSVGDHHEPVTLTVSSDGRRVLYQQHEYDLQDPFGSVRDSISLDGAPTLGPADAPVTLVEYSDFTCVYCRRFAMTIEDSLLKHYQGKVRLVYKNFPLTGLRAWSEDAAIAGVCAYRQGNDKFWTYHDKLFQSSPELRKGRPVFVDLAQQSGLDVPTFTSCLDKGDAKADVERDLKEGERLGVNGTPNFFVNGRSIAGLAKPAFFYHIIDQELAAAETR